MKKKIVLSVVASLIFAFVYLAEAQQPKKIPRIGIMTGTGNPKDPGPRVDAFRSGLRDLGYIEGKKYPG
jgi:putative tryptophan/tyrosine transport system substrate-binding protein